MTKNRKATVGTALLLTMLASAFSASAETVKNFSSATDRSAMVGVLTPAVAVSNGSATAGVTQVADWDDHGRFFRGGYWWRRDGWGRSYRVDRDDRWRFRDRDDRWFHHDRDD
ncbi:MAG: hypothetical protein ACREDR_38395, partial [Blastocatellia bacterium]